MDKGTTQPGDAGTLTAVPEPPDAASEYFEATSEEKVELPDGTETTLRYMEPSQKAYW